MLRLATVDPIVREMVDRRVHRVLRLVAWAGIGVFGLTALSGPWYWETPYALQLSIVMAVVALLHAAVLPLLSKGVIQPRHANATLAALLLAGVASTQLSRGGMDADELAASYTLELVATALLVLSWRAYAMVATGVAVAWTIDLMSIAPEDRVNWTMMIVATIVLGALAHATRLRAALRVEGLLLENDRKRIELESALEELRAHQREAVTREKLSALGTLVAGVAHEINNPLTYMRGNLELSAMTIDDARRERRALTKEEERDLLRAQATVLEGIDRIEHITKSLKQVARSAPGERRPTSVNELCDGVLLVAASHIGSDIDVRRDYRVSVSPSVNAGDISQVLLNLILNAADAMGRRGVLTVRTMQAPDGVAIEVEDTGPGVPKELRGRLFTPFFTTKAQGTGLGLSVSHRIVEDHGGTITYSDAPSGGARFRVTLPHARALTSPLKA